MFKNGILLLSTFGLSGCIGSYVVHGDISENDYGNLSTVPDRPQAPDPHAYQKEIDRLQKDHTQAFEQNEILRTLHKTSENKF